MASQAIASRRTIDPFVQVEAYVLNRFRKVAYSDINDMVVELPILASHREIYPVFMSLQREGIIKPVTDALPRDDVYMVPYILVDEALTH